MKANASAEKSYSEKGLKEEQEFLEEAIEEYLKEVTVRDAQDDERYGSDKRGDELPEEIQVKQKRVKKMKEVLKRLKEAEEELKKSKKEKINLTDTDARFQKEKTGFIPGYRGEIAVDSQNQIIVACDVTNEVTDEPSLVMMADKIVENVQELKRENQEGLQEPLTEPIKLLADSGYSSGANLAQLSEREEMDPYIPDKAYTAKERGHTTQEDSDFHNSRFLFDEEQKTLLCPSGQKVPLIKERLYKGKSYYYFKFHGCKNCSYFGRCSVDQSGRGVKILKDLCHIKAMRKKLSTQLGKKIYALRQITAEPAIGNLSYNLGFREFHLRRLTKVKGEFALMCMAHNLLKIAKFLKQISKTLKQALSTKAIPLPVPNTS